MQLLSRFTHACVMIGFGVIALSPQSASAQDGPACSVLRATDLTRFLPGDIGYNSFTSNDGVFQISNCNAIGDNASVSLRMISFLDRPNGSDTDLREILLDRYDPDIPFLSVERVTDNAFSYSAEGDLLFWSNDFMKMYIVDESPDDIARTRRIARAIASHLGLEKEEQNEVTFN